MTLDTNTLYFYLSAGLRRYVLMLGMNVIPISSLRVVLLRLCGVRIGTGCYVGFNLAVDTNFPSLITICDNVTISHNCTIITHTISPAASLLSSYYHQVKPVRIDSGAWIGVNTTILPGAIIEADCFIGAGSVVSGQMPSRHLCAGNPCTPVKQLSL